MTDSEKERQKNLRLAYEEANRWFRHIDNFVWALSSVLLAGTIYAIKLSINMSGKDWKVILIAIVMIVLWFSFRKFLDESSKKEDNFSKYINELESTLNIDVIPSEGSKGYFYKMMSHGRIMVIIIWAFFVLEFCCKINLLKLICDFVK